MDLIKEKLDLFLLICALICVCVWGGGGLDSIQHILVHCPYVKEKRKHLYHNIGLQ